MLDKFIKKQLKKKLSYESLEELVLNYFWNIFLIFAGYNGKDIIVIYCHVTCIARLVPAITTPWWPARPTGTPWGRQGHRYVTVMLQGQNKEYWHCGTRPEDGRGGWHWSCTQSRHGHPLQCWQGPGSRQAGSGQWADLNEDAFLDMKLEQVRVQIWRPKSTFYKH